MKVPKDSFHKKIGGRQSAHEIIFYVYKLCLYTMFIHYVYVLCSTALTVHFCITFYTYIFHRQNTSLLTSFIVLHCVVFTALLRPINLKKNVYQFYPEACTAFLFLPPVYSWQLTVHLGVYVQKTFQIVYIIYIYVYYIFSFISLQE
jgi:hypothetical protein